MPNCQLCARSFQVDHRVAAFLDRYAIPSATCCPDCRQQRRCSFRNSRNLYRRSCDLTGKSIISLYSSDKPYKVFDSVAWWSDAWQPLHYGRAFDFSKPFFEQFAALMRDVPRPALFNKGSENSTFTNHAVYNKNCYMCFNAGYCEDVLYSGDVVVKCKSSSDLTNVIEGELLLECTDCTKCYNCTYLSRCHGCSDSRFLFDCHGCSSCFLCYNLRNSSYCIENVSYSKEEYTRRLESYDLGSHAIVCALQQRFNHLVKAQAIHPAVVQKSCEAAVGDYLTGSKNILDSFDVNTGQDLLHCYDAWDIKDCTDTFQTMDKAEQQYETHASSVSSLAMFCNVSHENHDIQYCDHCFNSKYLFGCVGLRHAEYCILNQQVSKQDYRDIVAKIISHMRRTQEYGEFFPSQLSPFAYNETAAQDWYPLSQEEASPRFAWSIIQSTAAPTVRVLPAVNLPDNILSASDELCNDAYQDDACKRPFRIIPQELELYRKLKVPLPRLHPDERYLRRLHARNARQFRSTTCAICAADMLTTVSQEFANTVACERCYTHRVYG